MIRQRTLRLPTTILVVLAASAAEAMAADAGDPGACEAKIDRFARWIADAPRTPSFVPVSEDARLVERDAPGADEPQVQVPTLEVRAHGPAYTFRHQPRATIGALRASLADFQDGRGSDKSPPKLIVAVERDAKWSAVTAAVAAAAAAGFDPIEFGFARVAHIAAPPPRLIAETERISHSEDPAYFARNVALLFQSIVAPCPAAKVVFHDLGGVQANEKTGILMDRLPAALRACECATDPADMAQVVWLFLMPSSDGVVRRSFIDGRITVAPPGTPATVVRAKKDATWAKVYQRVLGAAKPGPQPARVRLEVQGR